MKAQMSFELLLYLSLAGLSMLYFVANMAAIAPKLGGAMLSYSVSAMESGIYEKLVSGYATFQEYVPTGTCSSGAPAGTDFLYAMQIANGSFCPDGVYATFSGYYDQTNGTYRVSRLRSN
ncbi:MAG: hypothetical protein KGH69_00950 [Candidatus Micrarchaeota archaeon]|nr:hypothetical protein [Candidatus Micrarchaeota archaeon]